MAPLTRRDTAGYCGTFGLCPAPLNRDGQGHHPKGVSPSVHRRADGRSTWRTRSTQLLNASAPDARTEPHSRAPAFSASVASELPFKAAAPPIGGLFLWGVER